jgi:hypothetical protein
LRLVIEFELILPALAPSLGLDGCLSWFLLISMARELEFVEYDRPLIFLDSSSAVPSSELELVFLKLRVHSRKVYHLFRQKVMPDVVFRDPIRMKNGRQTVTITTPKILNWCSVGIFVIPKTDVTKVRGRKNIDTYYD